MTESASCFSPWACIGVLVSVTLVVVALIGVEAVVPDISARCANYQDLEYYYCDQCCTYEGIAAWIIDEDRATEDNCVCKRKTHDLIRCHRASKDECAECCIGMNKTPGTGFTFAMDKEQAFTDENKCLCRIHFDDEE